MPTGAKCRLPAAPPIADAASPEWMRAGYIPIPLPGAGGEIGPVAPAVQIMVRNPAAAAVQDAPSVVRAVGLADTGASVPVAPLWAAQELGIEAGRGEKQMSLGAGGGFGSYHIMVDISVEIGGRWIDAGVVRALSPDTESLRRRDASPLFLLGRDGFLDKFNVCFDEPDRAMWIRNAGGGAEARRRQRG